MQEAIVNIRNGRGPDSNILEFSGSASGLEQHPGVEAFLQENGYTTRILEHEMSDRQPAEQLEIYPPLQDSHRVTMMDLLMDIAFVDEPNPAPNQLMSRLVTVTDSRSPRPRRSLCEGGYVLPHYQIEPIDTRFSWAEDL